MTTGITAPDTDSMPPVPPVPPVEPGLFHRLGLATDGGQDLAGWLAEMLGAQPWGRPTRMRQVHGLPFDGVIGGDPSSSVESGGRSQILWLGTTPLCLLTATDSEGPLGRYVARYGTGLHSVAWTIQDMWGTTVELERHGVRVTGIDLPGRHFFLHPRDTAGLLVELTDTEFSEDPREGATSPDLGDRPAPWISGARLAWTTCVVNDADAAARRWQQLFASRPVDGLPDDGCTCCATRDLQIGDTVVRFAAPRDSSSRYAAVLASAGPRLHSAAIAVPDLAAARASLDAHGVRVSSDAPATFWTHEADTLGLRLQWVAERDLAAH